MFTGAHLHLLVNHAPIFGSLFAVSELFLLWRWLLMTAGTSSV
jgi:hypothetical protein